ncbi:SCO family protein [Antarcticirhabdus aurantiaca]|uniref:SCO family protein n=1 Tax=Antarcticirhabdus aurantiaca TaxID=2606717 RepID=A0ACD4NNC8_9HYPH|nr:SCO family protein [Antarcticirhabdus aurantiaca]WAJ28223.1 SCO family protein [Jeongeuplla avenae]
MLSRIALAALIAAAAPRAAVSGPSVGTTFSLTTQEGRRFGDADLAGRPYLVFFGFTSCAEVCPTTLYEISSAFDAIGADAENLRVAFITVDPERDTPERLKAYLSPFGERFVALHGTPNETAAAAQAFRVTYRKVPTANDDYTMDHTALVFLMDQHGRFFDKLDYRASQEEQISKLRALIAAP